MLAGKRCTRLSKSDIRVQIVHSDHNATRSNDDEEDVKEPMVNVIQTHNSEWRCLKNTHFSSGSRIKRGRVLSETLQMCSSFPSGSQQQRVSGDLAHGTQRPPGRGGGREVRHQGKKKTQNTTGKAEGTGQHSLFCSIDQASNWLFQSEAHIKQGLLLALSNKSFLLACIK